MNWLLWVGLILTTWRVTRLLVRDEFPPIKMLRDWIFETFWIPQDRPIEGRTRWLRFWRHVGHSIAYLWSCLWCMSFWVALALWLFVAFGLGMSVPLPWLMIAIASGFTGAVGDMQDRQEQSWKEAEKRLSA